MIKPWTLLTVESDILWDDDHKSKTRNNEDCKKLSFHTHMVFKTKSNP